MLYLTGFLNGMTKRALAASLVAAIISDQIACAEPALRIVSFTADWCPTCRVLDPRIEDAIRLLNTHDIVLSQFDLSDRSTEGTDDVAAVQSELALNWGVDEIWSRYNGRTGFAVIAAFDTGEALGCLGLGMDAERMRQSLDLALRVVDSATPGERPSIGPECPDSKDQ